MHKVLKKSVKKMTLVDFDSIKKTICIYMYGTCRTVSWNVIIPNIINDNIVYMTRHFKVKYD